MSGSRSTHSHLSHACTMVIDEEYDTILAIPSIASELSLVHSHFATGQHLKTENTLIFH
jgi:hypothetical protein